MQLKHENFRIYRGVSLEKIPGLGQFLQSKKAKKIDGLPLKMLSDLEISFLY